MASNGGRRNRGRRPVYLYRAVSIGLLAFMLTLLVSTPSQRVIGTSTVFLAFPIILGIIMIGVFFDMIGVAAAAAEEEPFHAMAAKRIHGTRQAIWLVRHADRVSSFANDIVGDIAASLSGAAGAAIAIRLVDRYGLPPELTATLVLAVVTALTIGGKAGMKGIALQRANAIIFGLGRLLYWWDRVVHPKLQRNGRGAGGRQGGGRNGGGRNG